VHDLGLQPSAIVSFSIDGHDADAVKASLADAKINVSASRPSSTLLDARARGLPTVLRASPHYYNTEDDLLALVAHCRRLVS
jgi:selenocysteine lyase/cysteine desulfurase